MRVSGEEGDLGFRWWAKGGIPKYFHVTLNGEVVPDVVTADEEQGYVDKYMRNPDGTLARLNGSDEAVRERLAGKVEIVFTEEGKARRDGIIADPDGVLQ